MDDIANGHEAQTDGARLWDDHMDACDDALARGDLEAALDASGQALEIALRATANDPADVEWQARLASSWESTADVRDRLGDLPGTQEAFEAALCVADRLAVADPTDLDRQHGLARAQLMLAHTMAERGDLHAALRTCHRAQSLAEHLVALVRDNDEAQGTLWKVLMQSSWLNHQLGDRAVALAAVNAALEVAETLSGQRPGDTGWLGRLAASREWMGDWVASGSGIEAALRAYEEAREVWERMLAEDPDGRSAAFGYAENYSGTAHLLLLQWDLDGALAAVRRAVELQERQVEIAPGDREAECRLWRIHRQLGDVLQAQGKRSEALREHRGAAYAFERLAEQAPDSAIVQEHLLLSCCRVAELTADGRRSEARRWCQKAIAALTRMEQAGMHIRPDQRASVWDLQERLGL